MILEEDLLSERGGGAASSDCADVSPVELCEPGTTLPMFFLFYLLKYPRSPIHF